MKQKQITTEIWNAVNNVKQSFLISGNSFKLNTLMASLKNCGLPVNSYFKSAFIYKYPIKQLSRGEWKFINDDRIEINQLETILEIARNKQKMYKRSKKQMETTNKPSLSEEEAIALLKSLGYKIFRPQTEYIEV